VSWAHRLGKDPDLELRDGDVLVRSPSSDGRQPAPRRPAGSAEAQPGLHLADYLQVLRRHWRLVALAVVVCSLAAAVHYLITPKQYRASTTLQIERKSSTSITGDQNPWLENYWNLEYYPTQYRLLQSRGLAERVVVDLRLMEDRLQRPVAGQPRPLRTATGGTGCAGPGCWAVSR
jgi:uncharacterized protein involved in exopolysaccharide biosynthesis